MSKNELKMFELAKRFLSANKYASLTGTLMLKARGIDLGRESHDIDILLNDYAPNIIIPEGLTFTEITSGSGATHRVLIIDEIVVDILSDGEQPEIIDGLQFGTLDGLISGKLKFVQNGTDKDGKHYNDLVKLGFDFDAHEKQKASDLPW